ncbi:MAG: M14 family zinc carboxypeptidase [Chloroherpetonaceae bacterium]|nr:M14 family zinc carboxypeptidase [Chloroherpetonaceae bacterium]MDW8437283.1 M14 family zinc carboxypeptidase [Chloroherpetonaceae bacterium]
MNRLLFALVALAFSMELFAQDAPHRRVRIDVSGYDAMTKLMTSGIALEDAYREKSSLIVDLSDDELAELSRLNIPHQVLIEDVGKFYEARALAEKDLPQLRLASTPQNFRLGAMGGFLTLSEVYQVLDSMRLLYPNLITARDSVGATIEGRAIYAVKIGSASSAGKPQVLYTSLHHAREPAGMMAVIYYMWWLLENYGANAEATHLVDNREQWFIPVVNPDGYEHNRSTNPNGGGMWRKNRRLNSDQTYGVDLNRNYGPFEFWNAPNGGSSTTPSSQTYRGTAPFSEPETQAMRAFCNGKQFKACLNYHTYSNLLIYPYGYLSQETPDSLVYRRFARDMTEFNGYRYGTDLQTVGYATRGNSDDWMYGEQDEKPKIFAMTPEVGSASDGFWPQPSRIIPLCDENLFPNKYLAWIAGGYVTAERLGDEMFLPIGTATNVSFKFFNKGLQTASGATARLTSSNRFVQILADSASLGALASQRDTTISFALRLLDSIAIGSTVELSLVVRQNDVAQTRSFQFVAGTPQTIFLDSAETQTLWSGGTWGRTTASAFSGGYSWTDSPNGNYLANASNYNVLQTALNLSDAAIRKVYLSYQARWVGIEPNWDWCQVYLSTNNGASWQWLRAPRMKLGSGQGRQTAGQYGYDGTQATWVKETIDISAFKGSAQTRLRFGLLADGSVQGDGFYYDDVKIEILSAATSAVSPSPEKPRQFRLEQNYPNPFNPTTTIAYSLPVDGEVRLELFDVLGRQAATLVNERQSAGEHRYLLDASRLALASGVYFYRLRAGGFVQTRKLMLVK